MGGQSLANFVEQFLMSQQRVPFSMRNAAQDVLALAWRERMDVGLLNQLAGNSNQTDVRYTMMNAAVAPTTANWFVAGQANGAEASLTSANNMDLTLINRLKSFAQIATYPIRPIVFRGGIEAYIMIMHTFQAQKLKNSTAAGSWGDIQLAALKGGEISGNPLFTGALGLYENVLLFADEHIPYGNSVSNTRPGQALFPLDTSGSTDYHYNTARAVFLGAQAGVLAFGRAADWPMRIKWVEELRDAANILRVTAGLIHGGKKTINYESSSPAMDSVKLGELRETPSWAILN